MATFNGEQFLRRQIESIQAQTVSNWQLLIRDDGSTDATCDILMDMASTDARIRLLDSVSAQRVGPKTNFSFALESAIESESDIFFMSDQDDVWEPEKLAVQAERFPAGGREDLPTLVHSDLRVVDRDLRIINDSLVRYMDLEPKPDFPMNYLLTRNFVTGCATAVNRKLLEIALPVANRAIMHDWWLALVASATGSIDYVDRPLVNYRQHSENSIGAKGFWHGLNPTNNWVAGWKAGNAEYLATRRQVEAVAECADRQRWPTRSIDIMRQYLNLVRLPRRKRIMAARKLGLRQGNALLQLIFYTRLLTV